MTKEVQYDEHVLNFHKLVSHRDKLRTTLEQFLDNVVDTMTLGIIFEMHRKLQTGTLDSDDHSNTFRRYTISDLTECLYCKRLIGATKFAGHLLECIGKGRRRTRTLANTSMFYSNSNSDDEKKTRSRRNRGKNASKKSSHNVLSDNDSATVDVEGDEEGNLMLQDILQGDSNQSSPAESVASSNASVKRQDRSRNKRKGKNNSYMQ